VTRQIVTHRQVPAVLCWHRTKAASRMSISWYADPDIRILKQAKAEYAKLQ